MKKSNELTVDVIIPVYEPDEKLDHLLRRLALQTKRPDHVILLETVEDDDFFDEIKSSLIPDHIFFFKYAGIDIDDKLIRGLNMNLAAVKKSEFDHGGTRKYGASLSDADLILFMTQDAVPAGKKLIERLVGTFVRNPAAGTATGSEASVPVDTAAAAGTHASFIQDRDEKKCVSAVSDVQSSTDALHDSAHASAAMLNAISYARQLARKDADITERLTRLHNYPEKSRVKSSDDLQESGIQTYFCSDVCAMYDHRIFDSLGGFDEKTIFNEDMIMAAKAMDAGYTVTYCADARVIHSHSYTCMQQFHRNFDLGVSHSQHPEIFKRVSSEKEGADYAGRIIKYLMRRGYFIKCFYFCLQCGFKLFGYKAGKNYRLFPKKTVKKMSMNKGYWDSKD